MTSEILTRQNFDSPLQISVDAEFDGEDIVANVTIDSEENFETGYKLQAALAETFVETNPMPNGMTEFHYPMVWMDPDGNGTPFTAEIGVTQNLQITFPYNTEWSLPNLTVLVFVQHTSSKEVIQSATAQVPADEPLLLFDSYVVDDSEAWRPNERPDAGETVDFYINIINDPSFLPATGIQGTLTCNDDQIAISENVGTWPDLNPGLIGSNADSPFSVVVPEGYEPAYVTFYLDITADEGYSRTIEFDALMGVPDMLFVNDYDDGGDLMQFWETMFTDYGRVIDVLEQATPLPEELQEYTYVIWGTGSSNDIFQTISDAEQFALESYVANGGNLLFSSQYAGDLYGYEEWFQDMFGVTHGEDAVLPPASYGCMGVDDGPFPEAEYMLLGPGSAGNSTSPSSIVPGESAVPMFTYRDSEEFSGVGYDAGTYRAVYLGFPLESISTIDEMTTPGEVLEMLLGWLAGEDDVENDPSDSAVPSEFAMTAYPNPFNPDLTISYSLPENGIVQIAVFDVLGRKVTELANHSYQAGTHSVTWNATGVSSGIYYVRLSSPAQTLTQKVVLLR